MKLIPVEKQKRFNGKMPYGIAKILKGNELSLYIMLLEYHNTHYGHAFPTYNHIRLYFGRGWDNKRIRGYLKGLEEKGLIEIGKYKKKVGYDNNIYRVFVPDFSEENAQCKRLQEIEYEISKIDNAITMYEHSLNKNHVQEVVTYLKEELDGFRATKKGLLLEEQDLLASIG